MDSVLQDRDLVDGLRCGDEAVFREVVHRHHSAMVHFAETFVPSRAIAEEVAQEAWVGVIRGIARFEGRSSLSTWIFRIVANIGRTRGAQEKRTMPRMTLAEELAEASGPSVPTSRFRGPPGRGSWSQPPARWSDAPEERVLAEATFARVAAVAGQLSEYQRRVFMLRDIVGYTSVEVCQMLDISEVNQRVLLHRARSRIRAALESELGGRP